jgi:RNA polymerase sigma factor (sigma-70 family)
MLMEPAGQVASHLYEDTATDRSIREDLRMAPGEQGRFEPVYESSYRRLTLIVMATGGADLVEAQEIVQEAFAIGYAKREMLATVTNPEAWVCTVALNIGRRRWRRGRIADRLMRRERPAPPADVADVSANNADLYQAIRSLPAAQREAVFLHHLADLSVEDIAARTGSPIGTIKSRLARGRAALANQLAVPAELEASDPIQSAPEGTTTS